MPYLDQVESLRITSAWAKELRESDDHVCLTNMRKVKVVVVGLTSSENDTVSPNCGDIELLVP